jgi:hypothetical protein
LGIIDNIIVNLTDWELLVNRFVFISISMNFDPFTQDHIHKHGIWNSNCLSQEHQTVEFLETTLTNYGYTRQVGSEYQWLNRVWHRGDKKVVVCLVDDIRDSAGNYHTDVPYMFDKNTTVITDNYIGCPTQYRVWQLPPSFYGIYSNDDPMPEWTPDRQFCFSINRIDLRRLKLMLELAKRIHLHKGYVNFNCQYEFDGSSFRGIEHLPANFDKMWNELSDDDKAQWQASYNLLKPQMPLKNYEIPHHEIYTRSFLNIECETYSTDNTVALSEKIFRLLTLPVPWTAYMGRYAVAYLESLGFDCMSDLINHNHYDKLKVVENRIGIFIWKSISDTSRVLMLDQDQDKIRERCLKAATYNRELLKLYKKNWGTEFEQWKQAYLPHLA